MTLISSRLAVGQWRLSSEHDPRALAVVDGTGPHARHGPHYSRRTPGSRSFTGIGREIVLMTADQSAVWAVVLNRIPHRGQHAQALYCWRNMVFRNLGSGLSSTLVRDAVTMTRMCWMARYGALPDSPLRTEVRTDRGSTNPGYCYLMAGWTRQPQTARHRQRKILVLHAPEATL